MDNEKLNLDLVNFMEWLDTQSGFEIAAPGDLSYDDIAKMFLAQHRPAQTEVQQMAANVRDKAIGRLESGLR